MQEVSLSDGAGHKPCYSLRTLSRALDYVRCSTPTYGLQRSLYDGFALAFLTQLGPGSAPRMEGLITRHLAPGVKTMKVRPAWPRGSPFAYIPGGVSVPPALQRGEIAWGFRRAPGPPVARVLCPRHLPNNAKSA